MIPKELLETATFLLRVFLDLLWQAEDGACVIIAEDADFQRMQTEKMVQTASSYTDNITHNLDVCSEAFKKAFLDLAKHTKDDRFQPGLGAGCTPDPEAWGKVMDWWGRYTLFSELLLRVVMGLFGDS